MPSTLEVHDLLRPKRAEDGDLFLDPLAAVGEAHSKRLVLHLIPADANTENEAPRRQNVHLCRLLRHERRLPLGENEDRGCELQPRGDRGQITEQHERFVEHRTMVVGAGPAPGPVGVSPEDVVEHHQTVVAELLDGPRVSRDDFSIGPDLQLREHSARPHDSQYRGAKGARSGGSRHPH